MSAGRCVYLGPRENMGIQLSIAVRNARLDSIESVVGTLAHAQIRTGAPPASCAGVDSGILLVDLALPTDWLSGAVGGVKVKLGNWVGVASGSGIAAHFRLKDSTGTTCHAQGTVTATGGGGDMTIDNTNIAAAQTVVVTAFSLTDGNL